jgi:CRP-like cAMP-binding protein
MIFKEGEPANEMYFIGRRTVKISHGDSDEPSVLLQDGSFLDEAALLHQQPRNATAISLDYRDLYSLSKSDFEEILDRNPGFAQYI